MKQGLKYACLTVLGGAIGATIAVLTAPASGGETRRRFLRSVDDERHALVRKGRRAMDHATDYIQGQLKQGRKKLAQVVQH